MLRANHLSGFGALAGDSAQAVFLGHFSTTDDQDGYSVANVPLGPEAPGRLLVVTMASNSNAGHTGPSANIAGVSGTLVARGTSSSSGFSKQAMFQAIVPTGLTGTISVSTSGIETNWSVGVFALYNLKSTTPTGTAGTNGTSGAPLTVAVERGGVVIGSAEGGSDFSGLPIEDYRVTVGGLFVCGQHGIAGAAGNVSVTQNGYGSLASWR